MESFAPLLEKTRVPQPSLQKYAVISVFSKLRSAPKYLDLQSEPGRDAIAQCLNSSSPAIVDQSIRELCRLVTDSVVGISRGLLELQSALEGTDPKFVSVFVKGLGFLVRLGFQKNNATWRFNSTETHPFVKVLLSRSEVQPELLQQVCLFMLQNKRLGMIDVCEFLRPLLNFSVLRLLAPESPSSSFTMQLIFTMASFCCSFPSESMPVFKLLTGCLKYFPHKTSEDYKRFVSFVEQIVEAYIVVLKKLAGTRSLLTEAQQNAVEFLDTILSLVTCLQWHGGGNEFLFELSRRLLSVQKDHGLTWLPGLSSTMVSLWTILVQSELEHVQISILKLISTILKWKYENDNTISRAKSIPVEEILFLLPVISLMSSPSKHVKGLATELLYLLEKLLVKVLLVPQNEPTTEGVHYLSTPGIIISRLLHHLWYQDRGSSSGIFPLNMTLGFSSNESVNEGMIMYGKQNWVSQVRRFCSSIVNQRKSILPLSHSQEVFLTEMPLLLSAVVGILLIHPSIGAAAVDSLVTLGLVDPKLGVPLLLTIMFYSNIFTRKDVMSHDMLLKIFEMLPSLASHSTMIPLVVQTILPMLNKDGEGLLCATATRLLCRTWEVNDRAFGSLQGVLLAKGFTDFVSDRIVCISQAASIRDVCQKNPDRGVDLILSVSSCIESPDLLIKSIGLQSLAHLCEADVIDFYTAWIVIEKHVKDYLADPVLAQSICHLLRWGAMDAEAYSEEAKGVLQLLWSIVSYSHAGSEIQWEKPRISALQALTQYEVSYLEQSIPDFKKRNLELLFSETSPSILRVMEDIQVKIITYEHINRRRSIKEKRVTGSKIEKLMDVFPQVIFSSGKITEAKDLPGAALICLSFTPKKVNEQQRQKGRDALSEYVNALVEMAGSLQLSRNILVALMALQSWKCFMRHWMRAHIFSHNAKAQSAVLDKTSKAASTMLKSMIAIGNEAIPRCAENIALAVGALCVVLPPSDHTVKSAASKFLLEWLLQQEHEHRQWSAAISLGLISSCLHATDHKQRYHNITGLLELHHTDGVSFQVLLVSKSSLVKGACGVGLGLSCQDLLTRTGAGNKSGVENDVDRVPEFDLLGRIVRALSAMICQITRASSDVLDSLCSCFPSVEFFFNTEAIELPSDNCKDLEEDIWGVAGLVLGLAFTISAVYRAGDLDSVLKMKSLIISWIPRVNSQLQSTNFQNEESKVALSVGSCISIPIIVSFCWRMELMDETELDHIESGFKELISELIAVKKSGMLHQSFLMASCFGAGTVLSWILNEGFHSTEVDYVKSFLELFRRCYSDPYPSLVNLGGMLGVVNAMGVGAGILDMQADYQKKQEPPSTGLLHKGSIYEAYLTSLVQEMFLLAQNSDDNQRQQFASWALSFLRHHLLSKELLDVDGHQKASVAQSFSEDNVVLQLSLWLTDLKNEVQAATIVHVSTVVTVLRCLSKAPRLPSFDWGAIIRRCMRYEAQVSEFLPADSSYEQGTLREECVQFALAHANQFDSLLTFLDELSEFSRFRTLELHLQSHLLIHLADLVKVYSSSRLEKLFSDVSNYLFSATSYPDSDTYQKSLLRTSCWKGLHQCLDEVSFDALDITLVQRCMEVLFSLLPVLQSSGSMVSKHENSVEEWSEAVRCLGKAPQNWLFDFLKVSHESFVQDVDKSIEVCKKICAKAKLVKNGSLPFLELGKMKSYILNSKLQGLWDVLVEVVAALHHAEGSVKRQWLVDAVEISCVSPYPSTVLQFIGLLSATCCKYMPVMIVDEQTVVNDIPVTLTSLLADQSWDVVAESVVSHLCSSTERIFYWAAQIADGTYVPGAQPIDESEDHMAKLLLQVTHHTCVLLKGYLPLDKQLKLASFVVA
ncbi:protein RST1 isoform X3 [Neltuma alba]|uniref:protein RST1 isoform X3 n=1 Tax=Neltuma alba TaxID=207710 RepID=UPI0010A38C3E|nr:protein RST1 isoform X3 [Prosopis alba]